jgi:cytochrome c biogenesis protein CcmG/thiol:disulfide interchange protein DsbE
MAKSALSCLRAAARRALKVSSTRRVWLAACWAAFVLGGSCLAKELEVGKAAPDFQVTTFDGQKLALADFKGQVLVINFWATWCVPCRQELPMLDGFYRVQQRFGLRILAVTTEDSVPSGKLQPLAAALAFPLVRRIRGAYAPLKGVPTNYIIDRRGVLRYAQAGALSLDALNDILVPLLREPATPQVATLDATAHPRR